MKIDEIKEVVKSLKKEDFTHIYEEHLDKEDGYLIDRVISERKALATTFRPEFKEENILKGVKTCLLNPRILAKMETLSEESRKYETVTRGRFNFDSPAVVGRGFFREKWHNWNDDGAVECSRVVVYVTFDINGKLTINSAYPTVNEKDMESLIKKQQQNKRKRA